ncbi:hypothetical protein U14_03724 [Candidatus Moduliflexus flocculans]|uniref:Transcription factor zinc-finger domain-containing protein n=1 Tax=Candidatus Moduliflexus flocculans TaxID=1499966 RepID=A0A081BQ07_9BACT|nr:hypothetical protein U14_03724 [Candidatus Moduliflexus flocculans]
MSRTCPVCHIPLLQQHIQSHIVLDVCPQCRGIWFDQGELQQTYSAEKLPQSLTGAISERRSPRTCSRCHARLPLLGDRCPSCGATALLECPSCLKTMRQRELQNIVVDVCDTCQGVWLDGGELQTLFDELKRQRREHPSAGDLAAWTALDSLDWLFIAPDLAYHTGELITHLPDAVGGVIDGVGRLPEMAGAAAETAGNVVEGAFEMVGNIPEMAGAAAEAAGNLMEGAFQVVGDIPEIAGSVAEAGASFLGALFDLISSIFDN